MLSIKLSLELSVVPLVPAWPGVFTDCYRKDEERAQKLLTRVSEAWGKTTCLQLALEAKNMNFVSHGGVQVGPQQWCSEGKCPSVPCPRSRVPCCQQWHSALQPRSDRGAPIASAPLPPSSQAFLTKVWWGKMCVDNGLWRVIACMLFFPLLYTSFITFRYFVQPGCAGRGCRGISPGS